MNIKSLLSFVTEYDDLIESAKWTVLTLLYDVNTLTVEDIHKRVAVGDYTYTDLDSASDFLYKILSKGTLDQEIEEDILKVLKLIREYEEEYLNYDEYNEYGEY